MLIATGSFPDPERWNDDFAALAPDFVDELADRVWCSWGSTRRASI
ncbi:MAG: hypothetical protein R2882_12070 [Gemmatimonadales bacterium]